MSLPIVEQLGIALLLGLLVGFQREWTAPHVAGIRTIALVTMFGTVIAQLSGATTPWLIAVGLLAVAGSIVAGFVIRSVSSEQQPGLTTQMATLLMYAVGVAIGLGRIELGMIVGGSTAVLLHWRDPMHSFVHRLGETDTRAIIQLVLIGLVILPILPDRSYGPYDVLNPFRIWLIIVLIVGISLGGYIAQKFLSARTGALLGGVLGGVISSTATTVSYARLARRSPRASQVAAIVVMIASTVAFGRVIFEVAVVSPGVLRIIAPPMLAMMLYMGLICAVLLLTGTKQLRSPPPDGDPANFRVAILFGLLYTVVLLGVAIARDQFAARALFVVAALSGLTDLDAITLSTAQMIDAGSLDAATGWRMILVGGMSNLVFKGGAVALLGPRPLVLRIAVLFGSSLAGGAAILLFWR